MKKIFSIIAIALLVASAAWAGPTITRGGGGGGQPLDADLTTIAGLTVAQGKVIIGNSSPAWSASAFTLAAPSTSGNILKSDGTNWTSSNSLSLATLDMTSATSSIPMKVGTDTVDAGMTAAGKMYFESDTEILSIGDGATIISLDMAPNVTYTFPSATSTLAILGANTFTGNQILDDGTGNSPTLTFTDATDETAVFEKVDSGYLTITTLAADGVNIVTGNLKVGNGSPGQTIDGEDAYIEGLLEVDGVIYADGGITGATANNPHVAFNETDGTDWWIGVNDTTTDVFEIRTNATAGSNVGMNIDASGNANFTAMVRDVKLITAKTADYTVTAADMGGVLTNAGDDGTAIFTLPEASTVLGRTITFVVLATQVLNINPADGTDQILYGGCAAGDSLQADAIGETIVLMAVTANQWAVLSLVGTWTDAD